MQFFRGDGGRLMNGSPKCWTALASAASLVLVAACASGGTRNSCSSPGACIDGAIPDEDAALPLPDAGPVLERCPAGEAMVGRTGGELACAPLADAVVAHANDACSVHLGWRDDCDGCDDAPEKWGSASGASCQSGFGVDGTCTEPTLGDVAVDLYGLNTDGDVNDDDKFYAGFGCESTSDTTVVAETCPAGQFVVGLEPGGALRCAPVGAAAESAMNAGCSLYFGWSDSCAGCTSEPSKWGRVNALECVDGAGVGGSCTVETLGDEVVRLYGLDIDGDVDANDQFYVGLRCAGAETSEGATNGTCPADAIAVGTWSDGTLHCASVAARVESVVNSSCHVYLGWRDHCNGCTDAPTKWGRTSGDGACESSGENGVCITPSLGGEAVTLYGVNTVDDVNEGDKFYVGFRCE
jgi:hypothetical protein